MVKIKHWLLTTRKEFYASILYPPYVTLNILVGASILAHWADWLQYGLVAIGIAYTGFLGYVGLERIRHEENNPQ